MPVWSCLSLSAWNLKKDRTGGSLQQCSRTMKKICRQQGEISSKEEEETIRPEMPGEKIRNDEL